METILSDVFAAAPDEPFKPQRQAYISKRKNDLIDDLIVQGEKVYEEARRRVVDGHITLYSSRSAVPPSAIPSERGDM